MAAVDVKTVNIPEKSKTSLCKEVFGDFKRFLRTENKVINGMNKEEVKALYSKEYKIYRSQVSPTEVLPPFYKLFRVLFQQNLAHFDDDKIFLGPTALKTPGARGKGKPSLANGSMATPASNLSAQYARHRALLQRMAVDQHLAIRAGSVKLVDQPEFKGDKELWKHIRKANSPNMDIYYCTVCTSKCNSGVDVDQHVKGKRHRLGHMIDALKNKKEDMIKGVKGLTVTCNLPSKSDAVEDGNFYIELNERDSKVMEIRIMNESRMLFELAHCEMMKSCRVFTLHDPKKVTDGVNSVRIKPGGHYSIFVRVYAENIGVYHCPLILHMISHNQDEIQTHYILRNLHCKCTDDVIEELKPSKSFKKPPRVNKKRMACLAIVPGYKLPRVFGERMELEREICLEEYRIPGGLRKVVNRGLTSTKNLTEAETQKMTTLRTLLEQPLNMDNYQQKMKTLLQFEELQMEVDIRRYDMEKVTMTTCPSNPRLLQLKVPGLSENRPSVLKGDWLYVSVTNGSGESGSMEYQGFVHDVLQETVNLGFHGSFRSSFIENQKFNVRFVFNRLPTRLQHRSCQLADELSLGPILFPEESMLSTLMPPLPDLRLYDKQLESNQKQMCAVQHIVAGTSKPAPYLVFGPPGTGKTVTVVEAIKQVVKTNRDCHILACTPSNSAADLIAQRLITHISPSDIIRLNAASRNIQTIPEKIWGVSNYDNKSRGFYYPSKFKLQGYKVIIATLVTAGRLVSAKFPSQHFTHIFIDEAGHAPETEALIAIAGIMEVNPALRIGGQVVIAGDPKQLGPVLRSPLAIKYGLDISLLERYMEKCEMYQPHTSEDGQHRFYNVRVITKLLNNYRSHPHILSLPNRLFYDGELEPCANRIDREKLCDWEKLPKPGFPVLFHSVIGEDMREERSPSFFNPQEVSVVLDYVNQLMNLKKLKLKESDIGVISPYRKQVQKIQRVLQPKYNGISVGSVEEFQGQERTVIIVSTVRSNPEYLSLDTQFKLGFLRNPKRFNVTITRAKALLIVIGNPNTLTKDDHWRQLIEFCEERGSYVGVQRSDDDLEDVMQRLQAVQLIDEELNLCPDIQSEHNEQAWRCEL